MPSLPAGRCLEGRGIGTRVGQDLTVRAPRPKRNGQESALASLVPSDANEEDRRRGGGKFVGRAAVCNGGE